MSLPTNPYGLYVSDNGPEVIPSDEIAIIVPKYNTNKPDATGAFHPESENFCDEWGLPYECIHYINNKLPKRLTLKNNVTDALLDTMEDIQASSIKPISVWIFFCHGYTHGMQFGIKSPGHRNFRDEEEARWHKFINIIGDCPEPVLVMYACSTGNDPDDDPDTAPGSGDGSWGDWVRDELCKTGAVYCRVLVHTTAGHTTRNPFIKLLDGLGLSTGGVGGELIAAPRTSSFRKLQKLLKTNFRFKIPFLTLESIRDSIN